METGPCSSRAPARRVELEEGPLVVSNFGGPAPEGVQSGMALRAVFDDVTPEVSLVRFVTA